MRNERKNPRVNDEQDPMDEKPEQTLMVGTRPTFRYQRTIYSILLPVPHERDVMYVLHHLMIRKIRPINKNPKPTWKVPPHKVAQEKVHKSRNVPVTSRNVSASAKDNTETSIEE